MAFMHLFGDNVIRNNIKRRLTTIRQTDENVTEILSRISLGLNIQQPNWLNPFASLDLNADALCCVHGVPVVAANEFLSLSTPSVLKKRSRVPSNNTHLSTARFVISLSSAAIP